LSTFRHLDEVRWGIIGCGAVTEIKSGPAFNLVKHSRLQAVMRRDEAKARDYAARHAVPRWYGDARRLIADPEVDAIYVATPPSSHAEYAIMAMRAGKPVYVEKPMASTWADCRRVNEVQAATGVPLFVAYYRRSLPYFIKVRQLVDEGRIGRLLVMNIRHFLPPRPEDASSSDRPWRLRPEISGGGYFHDLASHTFDILDFIFGPIGHAAGIPAQRSGLYPVDDVAAAEWRFADGLPGAGTWCFTATESATTDIVEVIGSRGRLSFSIFGFTPIRVEDASGEESWLPPNPENIQYHLIEAIVRQLRGEGEAPSNGSNGARASLVLERILGGQG
jgi:predicted dehydrogenase